MRYHIPPGSQELQAELEEEKAKTDKLFCEVYREMETGSRQQSTEEGDENAPTN
jgi:hypothetical protein